MSFINSRMDDEIKKYGKAQLEGHLDAVGDEDDVQYMLDNFIIGTQKAKDFMGADAFGVIGEVQQYEEDNFGEAQTDLGDAEKVANMYSYIRGEELMDDIIKDYKRDRINDRKKSDRNNTNKKFDSGNDFKFRQ